MINLDQTIWLSANGCGSSGGDGDNNDNKSVKVPLELHACMGLNACKGHDRFGTNSCAGMGYCSTTTHVCHTLNNCRGQGGCGLYGSAEEQEKPGMNDCAWKGSCATPIQKERINTQGSNKGKSVWTLARNLFENRMNQEGRGFGTPPYPDGPPTKWLESLGPYDACGSSGNMLCTFGESEGPLCGAKTDKNSDDSN